MREAIRDAMAEEMRKNESVYIIGEEVGEYQGAYKVTQGLLDEFGTRKEFWIRQYQSRVLQDWQLEVHLKV